MIRGVCKMVEEKIGLEGCDEVSYVETRVNSRDAPRVLGERVPI